MSNSEYLKPVADGLPMRPSGLWARDKLQILAHYIATSTVAMKNKPWRRRFFVDLQAGPGKNCLVGKNKECPTENPSVFLGSPLLALTQGAGFTDYFFVEWDAQLCEALKTRCAPLKDQYRIEIFNDDCNVAVDKIVKHINLVDRDPYSKTYWTSLTLAFLDPEGLELHWDTVVKLANLRTDLLINFSIQGLKRNAKKFMNAESGSTEIDRFFGTTAWREIPFKPSGKTPGHEWIEYYQSRLTQLGYKWGTAISVKNRKQAELYRLIFASKHELGIEFWEKARTNAPQMRPLF